ncbi:hypothetical protein FJ656_35740, partial [Schumannella luteola]
MSDAASPQNGARRPDDESSEPIVDESSAPIADETPDQPADETAAAEHDAPSITEPATTSLGDVDAQPTVDADADTASASSDDAEADAAHRAAPQWTQEAPRIVAEPAEAEVAPPTAAASAEPVAAQETTEAPRLQQAAVRDDAPSPEAAPVPAAAATPLAATPPAADAPEPPHPAAPQLIEPEEPPATTAIPVAELLADSRDAESTATARSAATRQPAAETVAAPVAASTAPAEPIIPVPVAERSRAFDEPLEPTTGSTTYPTGAQPLPAVDHEAFSSFLATDDVEPPKAQHNRLFGAGFALLSSIVFGALYGGIVAGILVLRERAADWLPTFLDFVTGQTFVIPVVAYAVLALIFALLLNRAHWFAHVVTSLVLGALVYAAAIVTTLLLAGVTSLDSAASRNLLVEQIENPWFIVAGLAARETAMWFGFIAAARGRKVVARNREARERFDRDQAEKKAQRE